MLIEGEETNCVERAVREFSKYVGEEKLVRDVAFDVIGDDNARSNTDNKRLLRIREVLRDMGYSIPFKQYRKDNDL